MQSYDLQKEWKESGGDNYHPKKRVLLNTPFSGVVSDFKIGDAPYISHAPEHTSPLNPFARESYQNSVAEMTNVWGPSSATMIDFAKLEEATKNLVEGALSFDKEKVDIALKAGADPNTLVLVRDELTPHSYVPAPLGVAVALLAQKTLSLVSSEEKIQKTQSVKSITKTLLLNDDETSKVQVGPNEKGQMVLGYTVASIEWGAGPLYRQSALTIAQSGAIMKFLPQVGDQPVERNSYGIAYGEDVPRLPEENPSDLYSPARDTLNEAVRSFRDRVLNNQRSGSVPYRKRPF